MPGRGRRVVLALVVVALVLTAGRAGSAFLVDRWWEASVSPRVAAAGADRAWLGLALEVSILLLAAVWLFAQFTLAARIALPDRPTPERDPARTWPARVPRWSLAVAALVLGALLGSGSGAWLDQVLLTLDGVRIGVRDPLLGADLGVFVGKFPLWLELQRKAVVLVAAGLLGAVLLHAAGSTIRISGRRLWVSPRARGQLALLLGLLALALGWGAALEPYRLAAGLRGPLLSSEFLLHRLVSQIQLAIAALAALFSVLWWFRTRGSGVAALWALFGVAVLVARGLPLKGEAAVDDPAWRSAGRALDSVAFQLSGLQHPSPPAPGLTAGMTPTLWDQRVIAEAIHDDSSRLAMPQRGWLEVSGRPRPVWFTVREQPGQPAALLAFSDDRVSASGGPLAWREADSAPIPGVLPFRELVPHSSHPLAPRVSLRTDDTGSGVPLRGWLGRVALAWALQDPRAFSAPEAARLSWRLDPATRLRAVAPFAEWTAPRVRLLGETLVWLSDGLLTSRHFPSSRRVGWGSGEASMVRSTFLGVVYASTGEVRVFLRSHADSLGAAWARITRPLVEARDAIPVGLLDLEAYPEELVRAQVQALEGPAWQAGRLELRPDGTLHIPPSQAGGSEHAVPFVRSDRPTVGAVLQAIRTPSGDALRLIQLDSLWTVEASANLIQRWRRFPFLEAMGDSIEAMEGTLETGRVRYAVVAEGIVAYQPAWSLSPESQTRLVLVNLALGRRNGGPPMLLGTGRALPDAWKNLQHLMAPTVGGGAEAILEQAWRLMLHADSALNRLDFQELRRTLAHLRDLLEPRRR